MKYVPYPEKPHDANVSFLFNACLLLCVTNFDKWTGWDVFTATMAVANVLFWVFRAMRMSRWEKRRDAWLTAQGIE